tara:strand:- start:778 stop:1593 length:816 start_codon:yes stop_codon:yes gene_type:complete
MKNLIDTLKHMRGKGSADVPIRQRGALLALKAWGEQTVAELPILVNFGVLKALTGDAPPLLSVRSAASRLVRETDMHSLPSAPSKLLRSPVVLQASSVRKPLFASTVGLACYELDEVHYLLGLTAEGGAILAQWCPKWIGGELDASVRHDTSPLIDGISATEHKSWAKAAAQYLVTLGVLLEAENGPLELRRMKKSKHNERGIFFEPTVGETVYQAENVDSDKLLAGVQVTGHLKRQRYGPGRAGTKWIWVSEYSARRWVSHLAHYVEKAD